MRNNTQIKGFQAEQAATYLLLRFGATIVQRNFRCRAGEIDIIAMLGKRLLFVEVRLRSNGGYAGAAESVDRRKQQKLISSARYFLKKHQQWQDYPCRFDVIAFEPRQSPTAHSPNWIQGAFTL